MNVRKHIIILLTAFLIYIVIFIVIISVIFGLIRLRYRLYVELCKIESGPYTIIQIIVVNTLLIC